MKFKRATEAKFNHYLCDLGNGTSTLLLGIPKDISQEEAVLLADSPLLYYSREYLDLYFKLNISNRQIIDTVLMELEKKEHTIISYDATYFNILLDFIFTRYDRNLYDICGELNIKGYSQKYFYDQIKATEKAKRDLRPIPLQTLKTVCAYYLFSDDIIKTGRGSMYTLSENYYSAEIAEKMQENYTANSIWEQYEKSQPQSVKQLILKLTNLKEESLSEIPVKIPIQKCKIKKELLDYLMIFMNALYEKQER